MEVNKEDLYVCRDKRFKNFIGVGIEGDALILKQGLEQYLQNGKLKGRVEFSPILPQGEGINLSWFLVGNIYSPEVCTMNVDQYAAFRKPDTSIVCIGTGESVVDLVYDFAKNIELEPYAPSEDIISEIPCHLLVYQQIYDQYRSHGRIVQKFIVSESLKEMQRGYRKEAGRA